MVALARKPGRNSGVCTADPRGAAVMGLCRQDGCGPGASLVPLCTSNTDLASLVGTHPAS